MTCRPEHDHTLKQGRTGTRNAGKEVHVRASDEAGSLVVERYAILHRRVLEEAHFSPNVVYCRDEEV